MGDRNMMRNQKIVRRSRSRVQQFAKKILKESAFLNGDFTNNDAINSIALLSRRELRLGETLGVGSYSIAYAVEGIKLYGEEAESAQSSFKEPSMHTDGCFAFLDDVDMDVKLRARLDLKNSTHDTDGRCRYAVKHVKQELLNEPEEFCAALADLVVEANYLSKFDHPNIVSVRGLVAGGFAAVGDGRHDSFFLMTDRLEQTLGRRMHIWKGNAEKPVEKRLYEKNNNVVFKMRLAVQISEAVEYLHSEKIVYRDLKPENVGFISDERVQLFDFGLSRDLPSHESSRLPSGEAVYLMSRAGSPRYMAPEVKNTGLYNLKADVYTWAIMCYELLSMKKSYQGWSTEELEERVYRNGVRPPLHNTDLPLVVQDMLVNAWEHDVAERWTMEQACSNAKKTLLAVDKSSTLSTRTKSLSDILNNRDFEGEESDFDEEATRCTKADTATVVSYITFNQQDRNRESLLNKIQQPQLASS